MVCYGEPVCAIKETGDYKFQNRCPAKFLKCLAENKMALCGTFAEIKLANSRIQEPASRLPACIGIMYTHCNTPRIEELVWSHER